VRSPVQDTPICSGLLTNEFTGSSKEEAQAAIGGNLNLAGGLCIACSILLIISLHASTVLAGYVMMTRRIMFWCNSITFVISAVGELLSRAGITATLFYISQVLVYRRMQLKITHLQFLKVPHFLQFASFSLSSSFCVPCTAAAPHTQSAFAFLVFNALSACAV
jgi:hypothetical protein